MSQSPWGPSPIAKLEQLSTVEAKHDILSQRDIRPGHTTALPGVAGDLGGNSLRFDDIHSQPKVLAPHLSRMQNKLDFDGQPRRKSSRVREMSTGQLGRALESQERVDMPDVRDEKGHNLKNRVVSVRNRGSD